MNIDTVNWFWPQWALLGWLFLSFIDACAQHGKDCVEISGDGKVKPKKHSAFTMIIRIAVVMFILIAGGFFK